MISIHLLDAQALEVKELTPFLAAQVKSHGFSAKSGEYLPLISPEGEIVEVLFGFKATDSFWDVAKLPKLLPPGTYCLQTDRKDEDLFLLHLAWHLGMYRFDRYRTQFSPKVHLVDDTSIDSSRLQLLVRSINWVRDLVNTPAEDMGPSELQLSAEQLAKTCGASVKVIKGEACISEGFPLTHVVGRASDRAPRVIELNWGQIGHKKLTLVGKGVCFDTGGLDLKTAAGMRMMKKDMAGAAHALALGNLIMGLKLPIDLRIIIPVVDNNLSANSYRPGDIYLARNGKSIEIGNTDAEGRLILADALVAACEQNPDLIIDFATLTGNRALGMVVSCFSQSVELTQSLQKHGQRVDDPVWSMPLVDAYVDYFKSDIADLVNIANTVVDTGTATAAAFLSEFVADDVPWVHCDLLGYNPKSMPGRPKGAEAMSLRAWLSFLEIWAAE